LGKYRKKKFPGPRKSLQGDQKKKELPTAGLSKGSIGQNRKMGGKVGRGEERRPGGGPGFVPVSLEGVFSLLW